MAVPLYTPRINNNDDFVNLVGLFVAKGDRVATGQILAEIETDKASFSVEATGDGFVLGIPPQLQQSIAVGSVLMWIGDHPEDAVPTSASGPTAPSPASSEEPTLKALLLLSQYRLAAHDVRPSGPGLSAADVLEHVRTMGPPSAAPAPAPLAELFAPESPGQWEDLSPIERGMMRTVAWHRDHAVPGYLEIELASEAWNAYAQRFQQQHRLLMNPLLGLMAHRLASLARQFPKINATVSSSRRFVFDQVNLGFTIQTPQGLFLAVVPRANELDELEFVNRLGYLQRSALKLKLTPADTQGATVSFSSMARWKVIRHTPILPPYTSFMVAHASGTGKEVLGATFDHRVLSGGDAVEILHLLASPEKDPDSGA